MQSVSPADESSARIRTPDQRLRVFISSTLVELAEERAAVRTAVERLQLAPVMFELGARPHPPRELYRAYLDQSDVFVGLYWERYGWVAPQEHVSGLEDEYNLAGTLPRLIYVKQTAAAREPRLVDLLDRIRDDDRASYKYFSTATELGDLVTADLATLLAERFDQSRVAALPAPASAPASAVLPSPLDSLIGREHDLRVITGMLADDRHRLVTLTGPGGTGKTRLAIDAARQSIAEFGGGVYFVELEGLSRSEDVLPTVARTLGVRDDGSAPIAHTLALALEHRHVLLVLDNFEHVVAAGPEVAGLLAGAPGTTALVTSRAPLRVRGEQVVAVDPLAVPADTDASGLAAEFSAVRLFVERARAAKPDFELTAENLNDVVRLCRALDGLPLALELAAARVRMLPPAAMVEHLDGLLGAGPGRGIRDLPRRQQTLRSTVVWSTNLLAPGEAALLARLGVFAGGFSLEAAESITDADDVLTLLENLVDSSLVRQHDREGEPRFTMLAAVREWSRAELTEGNTLDDTRERHARYFRQLAAHLGPSLTRDDQVRVTRMFASDHENIVAAVAFFSDSDRADDAAELAWELYVYWWVAGHLGEVSRLMKTLLASGTGMSGRSRAIALYFTYAITFWLDPDRRVIPGLEESAELFREAGDPSGEALARISLALGLLAQAPPDPPRAMTELHAALACFRSVDDRWGEALTLVTLGRGAVLGGDPAAALEQFEASLRLARAQSDRLGVSIATNHIAWARLQLGEVDVAASAFVDSLDTSVLLGHTEGIAYGLEGLVAIAAARRDITSAGRLLGASESLRRTTGLFNVPTFSFHEQALAPILAGPDADALETARREGLRMTPGDAIGIARDLRVSGG